MNYLFLVDSYYLEPSSNGVCSQAVITELQKIGHKVTVISMGNRNSVKILENGLKHYQVKYNFVRLLKYKSDHSENAFIKKLLWFLFLTLNRLTKLVLLPFYPLSNPLYVRKIKSVIQDVIKNEKAEIVVAVYKPIDFIAALMKIEKRPKSVAYILDSLYHTGGTKLLSENRIKTNGWKWERKILDSFDLAIFMKSYEKDMQIKRYDPYRTKIHFSDFPLFLPTIGRQYKNNNTFLFGGTLNSDYRNPKYCCEFFKTLLTNKDGYTLELYTKCNCMDMLLEYQKKSNKTISISSFIPHSKMKSKIDDAYMLVNIGNKGMKMVPAKIFEMMSTMKPIIHFYYDEDDSCLPYLKKYPLACLIDEKISVKDNIVTFIEFEKNLKQILQNDFDAICNNMINEFMLNTPKYTAEVIEKYV